MFAHLCLSLHYVNVMPATSPNYRHNYIYWLPQDTEKLNTQHTHRERLTENSSQCLGIKLCVYGLHSFITSSFLETLLFNSIILCLVQSFPDHLRNRQASSSETLLKKPYSTFGVHSQTWLAFKQMLVNLLSCCIITSQIVYFQLGQDLCLFLELTDHRRH